MCKWYSDSESKKRKPDTTTESSNKKHKVGQISEKQKQTPKDFISKNFKSLPRPKAEIPGKTNEIRCTKTEEFVSSKK